MLDAVMVEFLKRRPSYPVPVFHGHEFQPIRRDMAVVVKTGVPFGLIWEVILAVGTVHLRPVPELFDVFVRSDGRISYGIRLTFQPIRALTREELDLFCRQIALSLHSSLDVEVVGYT